MAGLAKVVAAVAKGEGCQLLLQQQQEQEQTRALSDREQRARAKVAADAAANTMYGVSSTFKNDNENPANDGNCDVKDSDDDDDLAKALASGLCISLRGNHNAGSDNGRLNSGAYRTPNGVPNHHDSSTRPRFINSDSDDEVGVGSGSDSDTTELALTAANALAKQQKRVQKQKLAHGDDHIRDNFTYSLSGSLDQSTYSAQYKGPRKTWIGHTPLPDSPGGRAVTAYTRPRLSTHVNENADDDVNNNDALVVAAAVSAAAASRAVLAITPDGRLTTKRGVITRTVSFAPNHSTSSNSNRHGGVLRGIGHTPVAATPGVDNNGNAADANITLTVSRNTTGVNGSTAPRTATATPAANSKSINGTTTVNGNGNSGNAAVAVAVADARALATTVRSKPQRSSNTNGQTVNKDARAITPVGQLDLSAASSSSALLPSQSQLLSQPLSRPPPQQQQHGTQRAATAASSAFTRSHPTIANTTSHGVNAPLPRGFSSSARAAPLRRPHALLSASTTAPALPRIAPMGGNARQEAGSPHTTGIAAMLGRTSAGVLAAIGLSGLSRGLTFAEAEAIYTLYSDPTDAIPGGSQQSTPLELSKSGLSVYAVKRFAEDLATVVYLHFAGVLTRARIPPPAADINKSNADVAFHSDAVFAESAQFLPSEVPFYPSLAAVLFSPTALQRIALLLAPTALAHGHLNNDPACPLPPSAAAAARPAAPAPAALRSSLASRQTFTSHHIISRLASVTSTTAEARGSASSGAVTVGSVALDLMLMLGPLCRRAVTATAENHWRSSDATLAATTATMAGAGDMLGEDQRKARERARRLLLTLLGRLGPVPATASAPASVAAPVPVATQAVAVEEVQRASEPIEVPEPEPEPAPVADLTEDRSDEKQRRSQSESDSEYDDSEDREVKPRGGLFSIHAHSHSGNNGAAELAQAAAEEGARLANLALALARKDEADAKARRLAALNAAAAGLSGGLNDRERAYNEWVQEREREIARALKHLSRIVRSAWVVNAKQQQNVLLDYNANAPEQREGSSTSIKNGPKSGSAAASGAASVQSLWSDPRVGAIDPRDMRVLSTDKDIVYVKGTNDSKNNELEAALSDVSNLAQSLSAGSSDQLSAAATLAKRLVLAMRESGLAPIWGLADSAVSNNADGSNAENDGDGAARRRRGKKHCDSNSDGRKGWWRAVNGRFKLSEIPPLAASYGYPPFEIVLKQKTLQNKNDS